MDYSYFKNNENFDHKESSELEIEMNPFFKFGLKTGLIIFVVVGLALTYLGELDFMIYDQTLLFIFAFLYFIILPFSLLLLVFLAIKSNSYKSKLYIVVLIFSIFNIPLFFYWQNHHETLEIRKNGIKTEGIVVNTFTSKGGSMYYEFLAEDKLFRSFKVPNPKKHSEGDTIIIVYNKKLPEMNFEESR